MNNLAVIKVGWSDDYRGSPVQGDYKYISSFKEAHDRFNFLPHPNGSFYGYAPPLGEQKRPPQRKGTWDVAVLSKKPKVSGLFLVGWFTDATFTGEFSDRPEYADGLPFSFDTRNGMFQYNLIAEDAVAIPPDERTLNVSGEHLKRSYAYLDDNAGSQKWRRKIRKEIRAFMETYRPAVLEAPASKTSSTTTDKTHIKEVEEAAITRARRWLKEQKYEIFDMQDERGLGYDLLGMHKDGQQLHVEVKGTAGPDRKFILTRSEYAYACTRPKPWRLAMVTYARDLEKQTLDIYDADEFWDTFDLSTYSWIGKEK